MKEWIILHIGTIGATISILLLLVLLNNFKVLNDTKYEIILEYYFLLNIIIGAGVIGENIFKWMVK